VGEDLFCLNISCRSVVVGVSNMLQSTPTVFNVLLKAFAHCGSEGDRTPVVFKHASLLACLCLLISLTSQVLTCTEHEQERLQFYCTNCQRLLCQLCKPRRQHHGHKVLPVAQAYQALKVGVLREETATQSLSHSISQSASNHR